MNKGFTEIINQIGGRERISEIANLYDKTLSNGKIISPDAYHTVGSIEITTIARALLAVLDAKPVGVTDNAELECLLRGEKANVMPTNYRGVDKGNEVYIYAIPPAANVPEITKVAKAMREWIDAIPKDVVASLPAMPGFDRDWADEIISTAKAEKTEKPVVLQGGHLKPDGKFWYDEDTISNILYQAGIEVQK